MKKQSIQTCLIALLLLLVAFVGAPAHAQEQAPTIGDLTGDGQTTAADAACLLRAVAFGRMHEDERPDLDFTKNGEINGMDARAALLFACGGIEDWISFGERVSSGLCDERLMDRFSYTGTKDDGQGNYRSENVSITISSGRADRSNYHLADICVQNIANFVTTFSSGAFRGKTESVFAMFDATPGAIVGMNGDFYSYHLFGPVVRNGETFVDNVNKDWDIAVLLSTGELITYPNNTLKTDELAGMSVYQTWVFGPALLDENGHAKTKFRSQVQAKNPRSVLGYYEPGHYAFLTVDGRARESEGMSMTELSALCESLGFTSAYNMDGGQSSVLLAQSGAINVPYRGGRSVSDILAIRELPEG